MQKARLARVGLHLAAQAGHLDVDGAFAGLVHAERRRDVLARQDLVGLAGKGGEQGRLAAGQPDDAIGAAQLAALGVEAQSAELDRALQSLGTGAGARRSRARMRSTSSRGSNGLPR